MSYSEFGCSYWIYKSIASWTSKTTFTHPFIILVLVSPALIGWRKYNLYQSLESPINHQFPLEGNQSSWSDRDSNPEPSCFEAPLTYMAKWSVHGNTQPRLFVQLSALSVSHSAALIFLCITRSKYWKHKGTKVGQDLGEYPETFRWCKTSAL